MYSQFNQSMTAMQIQQCMPMPKLAHAYVPFQTLTSIYPAMKGLECGTIFPDLDMPYGTNPEYLADA